MCVRPRVRNSTSRDTYGVCQGQDACKAPFVVQQARRTRGHLVTMEHKWPFRARSTGPGGHIQGQKGCAFEHHGRSTIWIGARYAQEHDTALLWCTMTRRVAGQDVLIVHNKADCKTT